MRQLRWDNYKGGLFKYTQEKTGTDMEVPASPRLIERLESITNRQDEIAICETTANPYSKDLLVKYFARIRLRSGLPKELQLRDLRRTGATEMAESGCTEDELRAVTGHQSREILATYVRPTTRLATSAVNKRFA
jgi:integrase